MYLIQFNSNKLIFITLNNINKFYNKIKIKFNKKHIFRVRQIHNFQSYEFNVVVVAYFIDLFLKLVLNCYQFLL